MGIVVGFSLQQFSEVLKIRDANGQPYVLIGGQAVNYWAENYLSAEATLGNTHKYIYSGKTVTMNNAAP
jgi:hypothetical protein